MREISWEFIQAKKFNLSETLTEISTPKISCKLMQEDKFNSPLNYFYETLLKNCKLFHSVFILYPIQYRMSKTEKVF